MYNYNCFKNQSMHKCLYCEKRFTRKFRLRVHLSIMHSEIVGIPKIPWYKCDFQDCDKIFSEKGNLQVHKRSHTGEKPFNCDLCQKTFSASGNRQDHERRHLKIRYSQNIILNYYLGPMIAINAINRSSVATCSPNNQT